MSQANSEDRNSEWSRWLRSAIAGDSVAYSKFLTAITAHLRKSVRRGLPASTAAGGDAEDVVQEIVLAIHLKRHTWDPERPVLPWIMAIARNKSIDAMRRRGRQGEVNLDDFGDTLEAESNEEVTSRGDLETILRTLPERQRAIVEAVAIHGKTAREVADAYDMTEVAVRVTLHRTLKTLSSRFRLEGQL